MVIVFFNLSANQIVLIFKLDFTLVQGSYCQPVQVNSLNDMFQTPVRKDTLSHKSIIFVN